jgi:hypothetical protein
LGVYGTKSSSLKGRKREREREEREGERKRGRREEKRYLLQATTTVPRAAALRGTMPKCSLEGV